MTKSLVGIALILSASVARASSVSTSFIKPDVETESTGRKWGGEYSLALGGEDFTQGKDEGTAASLFFKASFDYRYSSWLSAHLAPRVDYYAGRLQERFETDDYKSRIRITEFYVSAHPITQVDLRAGAINQEYLNSPMLISKNRAFPGVQEIFGQDLISSRDHTLKAQIILQQTIPTSYTLNTERDDKEALPSFQTQSLHFAGKHFDTFEWKAFGGHFTWSDLPSYVAFQSRLGGNSVIGEEIPGSKFVSGFDGFFGGLELCMCVSASNIQGVVEFQRIVNERAGAGLGNGQMWGVGPRFIFGDTTLDVRYRRFFIEKDATVAVYMTSFIGNTNRMGDDVEFKLDFRDKKFAIVGEWANAVPIRDNALQQTITSIYLGVETHYVSFF